MVRVVLSCNSVFCQDSLSSLTSDVLLNIRETTTDLIPTFLLPIAELEDSRVKDTLGFVLAAKRCRRNKRAGAVRLRWVQTALPGIFLSNVHSLSYKLDGLQLQLVWKN